MKATADCGAVRHGAESFNFSFPQDFDETYLVVWEDLEKDYAKIPWKYCNMEELLSFLQERCEDDFLFPINPVWPARDPRWFEIYQKLKDVEGEGSWLDAELCQIIEAIAKEYPDGFVQQSSPKLKYSKQIEFSDVDAREEVDLSLFRAATWVE